MENTTPPPTSRAQSSIRSFFQPRQPNYVLPPSTVAAQNILSQSTDTSQTSPQNPTPAALKQPSSSLPPNASIMSVQLPHVLPLRRINSLLLPISYPDSFYNAISHPSPPSSQNFSRIILWEDKVIGGIVCRLDPSLSASSAPQKPDYIVGTFDIYIQSLVLLSPYRKHGLATRVLEEVVRTAVQETEKEGGVRIAGLYAHVWTENDEALEWYSKRGFKVEGPVLEGYYRKLKPDTGLLLRRKLNPSDLLENASPRRDVPLQSNTAQTVTSDTDVQVTRRNGSDANTISSPPLQRPNQPVHARSFQEKGPEREWNDLPEDVLRAGLLKPGSNIASQAGSTASSRSSSRSGLEGKGKKKRVYPAAAFGS